MLSLPITSITAFLADQTLGKSAGLLFSMLWLQQRLQTAAPGAPLFP